MDKWLQSRKSVLILVLLIIVLMGLFVALKKSGTISYESDIQKDKVIASNILIKKISKDDSDGDGLKDWEENLWRTNPSKADTDGDGTNDNDEILQSRDPLKPGPNDSIEKNIKDLASVNETVNQNLTETDVVARELLAGYLSLKQSGSLTSENQEKLVGAIAEKRFLNNETTRYSAMDITIVDKNDLETLKKYSVEVMDILKKHSGMENDLVVIKRALDNSDSEEAQKLNQSMLIYRDMEKKLSEITIPKDLVSIHLKILNTVSQIAENTGNMAKVFEDPIIALVNLNEYVENESIIIEEFAKIGVYLKNKGVSVSL